MRFLASLLIASIAFSAFAEPTQDQVDEIKARMAQTEARLNLTDEQTEQLGPILLDHAEKRMDVMKKHGITPDSRSSGKKISFRQLRAVKKDMDKINKEAEKQLAGILSKEQLDEYKRIQEEQRGEMRSRMTGNR